MGRVTLIRSDRLASQVPYAYAATAPAGSRYVFLAGACPLDAEGRVTDVGDYEGQARQVLVNLRLALEAAGCSPADTVQTRVLVASTRQADLVRVWDVVRAGFGDHDVPSTLLGVTVLGWPDQLVEVEAVAVLAG